MNDANETNKEKEARKKQQKKQERRLRFWPAVGGVCFVLVLCFYGYRFHIGELSTQTAVWGQFGDFMGGTLNPVFGFLTIILLTFTLTYQLRELRYSRDELEKSTTALELQSKHLESQSKHLESQSEHLESQSATLSTQLADARKEAEGSFIFKMIELHKDIVSGIEYRQNRKVIGAGPEAFKLLFVDRFRKRCSEVGDVKQRPPEKFTIEETAEIFFAFYQAYRSDLEHYFDSLTMLLGTVKKTKYQDLVRCHLSTYERLMLFYFGKTEMGETIQPYITTYGLLLGVDPGLLVNPEHRDAYPPEAYGETDQEPSDETGEVGDEG